MHAFVELADVEFSREKGTKVGRKADGVTSLVLEGQLSSVCVVTQVVTPFQMPPRTILLP